MNYKFEADQQLLRLQVRHCLVVVVYTGLHKLSAASICIDKTACVDNGFSRPLLYKVDKPVYYEVCKASASIPICQIPHKQVRLAHPGHPHLRLVFNCFWRIAPSAAQVQPPAHRTMQSSG